MEAFFIFVFSSLASLLPEKFPAALSLTFESLRSAAPPLAQLERRRRLIGWIAALRQASPVLRSRCPITQKSVGPFITQRPKGFMSGQ